MASEIERKFLVKDQSYRSLAQPVLYQQGYLTTKENCSVRIRIAGVKGFITVKDTASGLERLEFEYEIPLCDAQKMLSCLCQKPIIEKYRYRFVLEGLIWEVDEFLGENQGLILAELELDSMHQTFSLPHFIGREVTFDQRYRNSNLQKHPYQSWGQEGIDGRKRK